MARISGEQRRQELTAAAVRVLTEQGPAALTTRRVAEQAGAPLGTVHYAFHSKDELLAAATRHVLAAFAAALQDRVRPELGVRQAVADSLTGYWDWVQNDDGLALAAIETFVVTLRSTSTAAATVDAAHGLILSVLTRAAAADKDAARIPLEDLARLLLIAAEGLTLLHLATRDLHRSRTDLARLITALQAVA